MNIYNSTNHVSSGDFVGDYGIKLGKQVQHVDALSGVRSRSINIKALTTMLMYKVYNVSRVNRLYIFSCSAVCVAGVVTCPHKTAANITQLTLFMFC